MIKRCERRRRMSIRSSLCLLFSIIVSVSVMAQSPAAAPGAEHKRLDPFVGRWNIEGVAQASPYGPAGKLTSVDTFEWMPGGFFMTHRWDSRQGGVEIKGMEVIGYDRNSKVYTSRFFDNLGNTGAFRATTQGQTWTWTGDTQVGGKPLKERCTTIAATAATFTTKCEYSTDGAKWLANFDLKATRTK
jgi:hypothetical protein